MKRAVFVDKDGTLVRNVPYNVDPEKIELEDGAAECVSELTRQGFEVIVVSNQPGAALGHFQESALGRVAERMRQLVKGIKAFYYCPHDPDAGCDCRKPSPGLLERAAREHGVDLAQSWMVGDILDDVEAGRRAGCRTILLHRGHETLWRLTPQRWPDRIATHLAQVPEFIVGR